MSSTNYRHFVDKTMALAKSLTIKSEASVIGINQLVAEFDPNVTDDPRTWKYYQNLAGQYHFLDREMTVVSLDTQEEMLFTKENLAAHYFTQQNYRPGTRYYQDLVDRYPAQELLIRGIIAPVDMDTAINAKDFTILRYDDTYVEGNETNLIAALQQRIYEYSIRWHNPAYAVVDDLYVTANLAMLYYQLPGWIFNIRLENCKTERAHSFHIREYLRSHGKLDSYLDYLTKKQMLFLYRNILYIERNAGKQETFDWLLQRLLTERGIGLAEYTLHHNLDDMPDEAIRPAPEFTRHPLNAYHTSSRVEEHDFSQLLIKERPAAVRNREVEVETLANDTRRIQNAPRAKFPTKVLESALIDWSESGVMIRSKFLLNHWAYWASTKRYRTVIQINHPRTGNRIDLPVDHAFLLFLYTYNRLNGVTLETVPNIQAKAIRRQPTPSFEQLNALVDNAYVPEWIVQKVAQEKFEDHALISIYQFVNLVEDLFERFSVHREIYALSEHYWQRGQLQALTDHLYMDVETEFEDAGQDYEMWLHVNGYDVTDLTRLEYQAISDSLLDTATGIKLTSTKSARSVQKALVGLMSQLSSYTVQFLREFNLGPIVFWDYPVVRIGDTDMTGKSSQRMEFLGRVFRDAHITETHRIYLDLDKFSHRDYGVKSRTVVPLSIRPNYSNQQHRVERLRLPLARPRMQVVTES